MVTAAAVTIPRKEPEDGSRVITENEIIKFFPLSRHHKNSRPKREGEDKNRLNANDNRGNVNVSRWKGNFHSFSAAEICLPN